MEDKFICDGCGKKYPIEEFGSDVNTSNLAGIVLCNNCIKENKMEKYLGVKLIEAEPQYKPGLRHEADLPNLKGDGYKVKYEDGYESWSPKDVFEKAYRPIKEWRDKMKVDGENQEHQMRVINEAESLQKKVDALIKFIGGETYQLITGDERIRLDQQLMAMQYYLTILVERIENF